MCCIITWQETLGFLLRLIVYSGPGSLEEPFLILLGVSGPEGLETAVIGRSALKACNRFSCDAASAILF